MRFAASLQLSVELLKSMWQLPSRLTHILTPLCCLAYADATLLAAGDADGIISAWDVPQSCLLSAAQVGAAAGGSLCWRCQHPRLQTSGLAGPQQQLVQLSCCCFPCACRVQVSCCVLTDACVDLSSAQVHEGLVSDCCWSTTSSTCPASAPVSTAISKDGGSAASRRELTLMSCSYDGTLSMLQVGGEAQALGRWELGHQAGHFGTASGRQRVLMPQAACRHASDVQSAC